MFDIYLSRNKISTMNGEVLKGTKLFIAIENKYKHVQIIPNELQ